MSNRSVIPRCLRRITPRVVALTVLFCLSFIATSAGATVMKYADAARLIEISDTIVQGTVVEQKSYFDKAQEQVVTDTTIAVEKTFLGKPQKTITLQQFGGTYEGRTSFIPGDARFETKKEVIVFLHRGSDGVVALSALGQAKYDVSTNASGEKIVTRDFSDISFLLNADGAKGSAQPPVKTGAQLDAKLVRLEAEVRDHDSFVAELEALIAGIKGVSND